jgi:hypothetical protein
MSDPYYAPIGLIDDALRLHIETIRDGSQLPDEDKAPANALLSDWVIITSWIDPGNDEHYYFRLNSKGCAPHSREGLAHMLLEMEN